MMLHSQILSSPQQWRISQNREAMFLIIIDLAEKADVPISQVIEWLKAGQPRYSELPPIVTHLLSSTDEQ